MADLEKIWNRVLDRGSKKAIANLRNIHANNPRFQEVLKNRGEEGGSPSAAAAKKVKVEPRKIIAVKPDSIRALNAARQQAYLAKGGRQPIGAMGSGGNNVMAGGGQSTIKDLKASIKAGFNPRVSLDPYESERAKKIGPRSLKMKKEEVQIGEAMSPEAAKKKRMFDLKLKLIKPVANKKAYTKSSKVDEPHASLNPAADMKLNPRPPSGGGKEYYREEVQIDEVTKKEAESMLGGPVKEKPKMPPGKQPAGYRYVRNLARKAMNKGAVAAVHRSMEKTMAKEEVELDEVTGYEGVKDRKDIIKRAAAMNRMGKGVFLARVQARAAEMKKEKKAMKEEVKDQADVGEYDYEGDMAKSQLRSIMANSKRMHDMFEENTNLPEWVQSKITLSEDYISTAANYMEGEMNEEVEQLSERSYLQYSGVIHSNVGNAKHGEEKDEGHHYTLTVPSHRDVGDHLSGKRAYSRVARENPHLEPHHVKAILQSTGNDKEDVEVEHGGKTYKHRLYNNQDPDYIGEEVEQIDEVGGLVAAVKKYGEAGYVHDQAGTKQSRAELSVAKKQMTAASKERGISPKRAMKVADRITMRAHGDDSYKDNRVGKMKEEAEGKVAVTPKEKDLAAHHGDKTRITYGDVIKARLKSAAAKKMGK